MPRESGGVAKAYFLKTYRDNTPSTQLTIPSSDYADLGELQVPKRVKMDLTWESVVARKKMLAATWSGEVSEDLRGAMNIDIDTEMLRAMVGEILREIELMTLTEIETGAAAGNVDWHYTVPDGTNVTEWYGTLFHSIVLADKLIRDLRYQPSNFIVCGTTAMAYLQMTRNFVAAPGGVPNSAGTYLAGTYNTRWTVFSSNNIDADKILVSFFPTSPVNGGYIYMPYIPLTPMPLMQGEMQSAEDADMPGAMVNNDGYTRNVRTRYGRYFAVPDMWATVTIVA
jgi:hypothetical protein